jgi:hypothetical protein
MYAGRHLLAGVALLSSVGLHNLSALAQSRPLEWQRVSTPAVVSALYVAQQAPQPAPAKPELPKPELSTPESPSVVDPIPPLVSIKRPWPSPNLNPGVPSAFIANWGDVYITGVGATAGSQRPDADGSWVGGFGLGDATKAVAVEVNGGCGSFKQFCSNGGLGFRISRVLIKKPTGWLALAGGWQNAVQWGNEGDQDNIYSAGLSYAFPLRPIRSGFGQTLQINAGVGNSSFAPYSATNSEDQIGGFASIGVELSPAVGISAGWSGRGANAQLSYTPFGNTPLTFNLLGADLFNQNPSGAVAVFSVSWGTNYLTPNFP